MADIDVTVGGVVSAVRSVSSSCVGTDVVVGVSFSDESVEPQDCKASIETSEMVSRPAHCLAIVSAYLLNVRELGRLTCEYEGKGCEIQRALCEQKVNDEIERHFLPAVASQIGYGHHCDLSHISHLKGFTCEKFMISAESSRCRW